MNLEPLGPPCPPTFQSVRVCKCCPPPHIKASAYGVFFKAPIEGFAGALAMCVEFFHVCEEWVLTNYFDGHLCSELTPVVLSVCCFAAFLRRGFSTYTVDSSTRCNVDAVPPWDSTVGGVSVAYERAAPGGGC